MRVFILWSYLLLVFAPIQVTAQTTWQLAWSDEFNGPLNSTPDPAKWGYDLGNNNGWGNQELEYYTNLPQNAHMDGRGHLVIHAESAANGYTSARLKTQGVFSVTYGRVEARIKLPSGQGIWPAFWMLGDNIDTVHWPQCGEIDIMENIGREPSTNHASLHGPGYSGGNPITTTYNLPNGQKFSDDFHTFAIQWSPQAIVFFVDGSSYQTVRPSALPAGRPWVFDHPFFLLLNVAIGGNFAGAPDSTTHLPQDMLVDYVRVYQATSAKAPIVNAGGIIDAASYGSPLAPGSLASIFGTGLARMEANDLFDPAAGAFGQSSAGASVLVNGVSAPLTYVSPEQINFQIPWGALIGTRLNVEVTRDDVLSNPAPVTFSVSAPSVFGANGTAILICSNGSPREGAACTLWANGLGPANPPQQDGVPSPVNPLAKTASPCTLTIGGVNAEVTYCGPAPGLIIYQVNFTYPPGITVNGPAVAASLTVNGNTGNFVLTAF